MHKLSTQAKEEIIKKALAIDGPSFQEIANSYNIGRSTLSKWIKRYKEYGTITGWNENKSGNNLSRSEQFKHILATATLDATALGIYCRKHGLYSFQLAKWKEVFMAQPITEKQQSNLVELKALRNENKQLKQEVRRKDSALAEATALLILKKKAALIWGDPEDA